MWVRLLGSAALSLALATAVLTGQGEKNDIARAVERDGCQVLRNSQVQICGYDYRVDDKAVEALLFEPPGPGPFPAVLMIPGYERTARDLIPIGSRLAAAGFAGAAVSQPGFGKSAGPADFVGPKTLHVLTVGYRKLEQEPFVDSKRMGIYGYSRGGMAASLLVEELDDVKAAVLGAGIYDFQKLYDESTLPKVKANMREETGMKAPAIRERSSILYLDRVKCPLLILHGGRDVNVPVGQALVLRDRLTALGKDFEFKLFPDREHSIGPEVGELTLDFFERRLK